MALSCSLLPMSLCSCSGKAQVIELGKFPTHAVTDKALEESIANFATIDAEGYLSYMGKQYTSSKAIVGKEGMTFEDGTKIEDGRTYYFEMEPIEWFVLKKENNEAFLMSKYVIAGYRFDEGNNSYFHSEIRQILQMSYQVAFSEEEKSHVIPKSCVENSGGTQQDPILLLSYKELTSSKYRFSKIDFMPQNNRRAKPTDLARACGIQMETTTVGHFNEFAPYWTRSNENDYDYKAYEVSILGQLGRVSIDTISGIRPCIHVDANLIDNSK